MNHMRQLQAEYDVREARALYMLVMEEAFGLSQTDVLLGKDTQLSEESQTLLQNIIDRLLQHEPVQYILGREKFCGHVFHVQPGVLIPRPETQLLVQKICSEHPSPCSILDIGTGSGCIAVTLAIQGHEVTAFDISEEALAIARKNAESLGTEVEFVHENILHPSHSEGLWDVIVSNPPYICNREASRMEENVLKHEPHLALFVPDEDPLLFYRAIAEYALKHLSDEGMLYFEINEAYPQETKNLLVSMNFKDVAILEDDFGKPRFIRTRKS